MKQGDLSPEVPVADLWRRICFFARLKPAGGSVAQVVSTVRSSSHASSSISVPHPGSRSDYALNWLRNNRVDSTAAELFLHLDYEVQWEIMVQGSLHQFWLKDVDKICAQVTTPWNNPLRI